jgi:hypothetical protein
MKCFSSACFSCSFCVRKYSRRMYWIAWKRCNHFSVDRKPRISRLPKCLCFLSLLNIIFLTSNTPLFLPKRHFSRKTRDKHFKILNLTTACITLFYRYNTNCKSTHEIICNTIYLLSIWYILYVEMLVFTCFRISKMGDQHVEILPHMNFTFLNPCIVIQLWKQPTRCNYID